MNDSPGYSAIGHRSNWRFGIQKPFARRIHRRSGNRKIGHFDGVRRIRRLFSADFASGSFIGSIRKVGGLLVWSRPLSLRDGGGQSLFGQVELAVASPKLLISAGQEPSGRFRVSRTGVPHVKKKLLLWLAAGPIVIFIGIATFPFGLVLAGIWWIGFLMMFLVALFRWFTRSAEPIAAKPPAVSRPAPTSPLGLS